MPPSLTLLGKPDVVVSWHTVYRDAGAYAVDGRDGVLASNVTGLTAYQQAHNASSMASFAALQLTANLYGPWIVSYSAQDAAGNIAQPVQRRLYINTTCPAGEVRCGNGVCSIESLCGLPLSMAAHMPQQNESYIPPRDLPPQLTLYRRSGDGLVQLLLPGQQVPATAAITRVTAGSQFSDPGAEAIDDIDGNITSKISRLGLRRLRTAAPTSSGAPQLLEYRIKDSAGNLAHAFRAVYVTCAAGEHVCGESSNNKPSCSVNGICMVAALTGGSQESVATVTLRLRGRAVVIVEVGQVYQACPHSKPVDLLCDQVRHISSVSLWCVLRCVVASACAAVATVRPSTHSVTTVNNCAPCTFS